MVEVAGAVAGRNLRVQQTYLAQGLALEGCGFVGGGHILGRQHVPSQVETGGCEVLAQGIGRLEVDALEHALLQFGRHLRTRLVMARKVVEHLGNGCKRLVELRRHLDEVARHTGTCQGLVFAVGQHAVQGVTKLMEHGGHLVPCQQRRLAIRGFCRVAHIEDDGQVVPTASLLLEGVHPGSSALGGTTVVVAIEQRHGLAVLVDNLKHAHVGMVGRNVGALLEGQSVDQVGGIEHAIDQYAVDIEVRLHLVVGDVEHRLLHLGRVVEAVVGLQLEIGTLALTGKVLDSLRLGIGLGRIRLDQILQEVVDMLWCLRHRVLQRVSGIVGITHQLGLLGTQLGYLADYRERVVLGVGTVGTVNAGLEDLLAQVAVVEGGEQRLLGGVDDDDGVGRLATTTLGIFLALGHIGVTQACQLFLLVNPHHCVVGGVLQLVAPLLLQVADAQVDGFHAFHLVGRQQGTLADEALIDFLQQLLVLARQLVVLLVVDLSDALEECLVERNLVLQIGQHRLHLLLYLANLRRLVGIHQGEECATDMIEQLTAVLEGQDGILESRRVGAVHNFLDIVALVLDSGLEGWQIVSGLNLTEIGSAKGQRTLSQQRILLSVLLAGVKR